MVEYSTHNPKIEGSNPASVIGIKKMTKKSAVQLNRAVSLGQGHHFSYLFNLNIIMFVRQHYPYSGNTISNGR